MTSSRARFLSSTLVSSTLVGGLLALFASAGCNFILNPANSDDVIRCKNTTECEKEAFFLEELRKARTDAACGAPGGAMSFTTSKENQVCSLVDKASVSCATESLPASDFADAVEAATLNRAAYAVCPNDKKGTLGCPEKNAGGCDGDLEVNEFGTCDNGSDPPLLASDDSHALRDVQDQHCRSYFCDQSFVCNTKTNKCMRCDDSLGRDKVGQGACADLAINGARSTVYFSQEELESECPDTSKFEQTKFGTVVMAVP